MTKIASNSTEGRTLHFVVVDDQHYAVDDRPLTLWVSEDHFSPRRRLLEEAHFHSFDEARTYCRTRHNLPEGAAWADDPLFERHFAFKYTLTHSGVPQPRLLDSRDAAIVFRVTKEEGPEGGVHQPVLQVCGSKDGLRRLAATLLLCADCESFDPDYHVHLDDDSSVTADLPVTIRSPAYLPCIQGMPNRPDRSE